MIKKLFGLIVMICVFCVGVLCLYRALLTTAHMNIMYGKVINKEISYRTSAKSGNAYCLAFTIENDSRKIAINLGTKSQAKNDSTINLIEIGNIYKFYLDPSVPTRNNVNWGINRIDYNDKQIFKSSIKLNLFFGILFCLMSIGGIIIIYKFNKTRKPA